MSAKQTTEETNSLNPDWEWLWDWLLAPENCDSGKRVDIVPGRRLHLVTSEQQDNVSIDD